MARQRAERIGERLRERRLELGLTQAKVATLLDLPSVTSNYVSRWERGEHEPNEDYLAAIATVLETTVADLMAGPLAKRSHDVETPDLLGSMNGGSQLDRIEGKLDELLSELPNALDAGDPEAQRRAWDRLRELGAAGPSRQPSPGGTQPAAREAPD